MPRASFTFASLILVENNAVYFFGRSKLGAVQKRFAVKGIGSGNQPRHIHWSFEFVNVQERRRTYKTSPLMATSLQSSSRLTSGFTCIFALSQRRQKCIASRVCYLFKFTETATGRELNAIDAEDAKNQISDAFRGYQLEKLRFAPYTFEPQLCALIVVGRECGACSEGARHLTRKAPDASKV